jgi:hypothetical protein
MVNTTIANKEAMKVIYNNGMKMKALKHTWDFHWANRFHKHINKLILMVYQHEDVLLVHAWKNNKSTDEVEANY